MIVTKETYEPGNEAVESELVERSGPEPPPVAARSKHDNPCFVNAGEDEPIFVLRAHDALAVPTVNYWIDLAASIGVPAAKLERARADVAAMEAWAAKHGCKRPD